MERNERLAEYFRLGALMGVEIVERDTYAGVPESLRRGAEARSLSSWWDGGKVVVHSGTVTSLPRLQKDIVFAALQGRTLTELLGRSAGAVEDYIRGTSSFRSQWYDTSSLDAFVLGLPRLKGDPGWTVVSHCLATVFGVDDSPQMWDAVRNAVRVREEREGVSEGMLRRYALFNEDRWVPLGGTPEALRRCGYPECSFGMKASRLYGLMEKRGMTEAEIVSYPVRERFQDPAAVVYPSTVNRDGRQNNKFVVLGPVSGDEALVLYLREGDQRGPDGRMSPNGLGRMNGATLVCVISNGDDLRWVGKDLKGMLGRYQADEYRLLGKGGAGNDRGLISGTLSQRLNSAANIVNNFVNPLTWEEKFARLSVQYEGVDALLHPSEPEISAPTVEEVLSGPDPVPSPSRDRLSVRIPWRLFSEAVRTRMHGECMSTVGDLRSLGEMTFRTLFGSKAARDFGAYLSDRGLAWPCRAVHTVVRDGYDDMDSEQRRGVMAGDFVSSLTGSSRAGLPHGAPLMADGSPLSGEDVLCVAAKAAAAVRWKGSSVYVGDGVPVVESALPVYLADRRVYNLADTVWAQDHPDLFEAVVRSVSPSDDLPRYVEVLLERARGITADRAGSFLSAFGPRVEDEMVRRGSQDFSPLLSPSFASVVDDLVEVSLFGAGDRGVSLRGLLGRMWECGVREASLPTVASMVRSRAESGGVGWDAGMSRNLGAVLTPDMLALGRAAVAVRAAGFDAESMVHLAGDLWLAAGPSDDSACRVVRVDGDLAEDIAPGRHVPLLWSGSVEDGRDVRLEGREVRGTLEDDVTHARSTFSVGLDGQSVRTGRGVSR